MPFPSKYFDNSSLESERTTKDEMHDDLDVDNKVILRHNIPKVPCTLWQFLVDGQSTYLKKVAWQKVLQLEAHQVCYFFQYDCDDVLDLPMISDLATNCG